MVNKSIKVIFVVSIIILIVTGIFYTFYSINPPIQSTMSLSSSGGSMSIETKATFLGYLASFFRQQAMIFNRAPHTAGDAILFGSQQFFDCDDNEILTEPTLEIYRDSNLINSNVFPDFNRCGWNFFSYSEISSVPGTYEFKIKYFVKDLSDDSNSVWTESLITQVFESGRLCSAQEGTWTFLHTFGSKNMDLYYSTPVIDYSTPSGCDQFEQQRFETRCHNGFTIAGTIFEVSPGDFTCIDDAPKFIKIDINVQNNDNVPATFSIEAATPTEFQTSILGLESIVIQPGQPGTWLSDLINIEGYTGPETYTITIKAEHEDRTPTSKLFQSTIDVTI